MTFPLNVPSSGKSLPGKWTACRALLLIALLLSATTVVYMDEAAQSTYLALYVVPILAAALWFGFWAGLLTGVATALIVAPWFVPEAVKDMPRYTEAWLFRGSALSAIGAITGYLQQASAQQKRAAADAERIDPMSRLPNKVALLSDLSEIIERRGNGSGYPSVVLLKATDLEDIIEVVGLTGGDNVIKNLAKHLHSISPNVTSYYRFSPSEIAFIVETTDINSLKMLARSLHGGASLAFNVDGAPIRVEPVLGVGHIGNDKDMSADEMVRRARVALRHALQRDKTWVAYEPTIDVDTTKSIELISRAEKALEAGEFELYFQPKIHLPSRKPQGVEALIRWNMPGEGIIPPGSFMPKLEQTSLITPFSRFVIQSAADYARSNRLLPVSINLSVRNLVDDSLTEMLSREIEDTGVPPEKIEVEITESAIMRYPEVTVALLERLRNMGIGISIDDFGTGYSSFSYLQFLPLTNLKIDREFIRPIEGNSKTRRVVSAMIELGHMLGLTVTAEGVEVEAQARILEEMGCDFAQGFLWSAPQPTNRLNEWLEATSI